jgi:hypothetical protein
VLIIYASIKQRIANLPCAKIKASAPRRPRTKQPKSGE